MREERGREGERERGEGKREGGRERGGGRDERGRKKEREREKRYHVLLVYIEFATYIYLATGQNVLKSCICLSYLSRE